MSVSEIEKMSMTERLEAMERLWDALCHSPTEPDSPEWHRKELEQRKAKIESGQAEFLTVHQTKERLRR